ncbi:MAG: hypothetical protein Q7U63_12140 [Polaromonas sp.]|uniref:hypothetical protein n=1 Tax=Polaromonas sp. TaxID=1869339 RepID=UPI002715A67E|nr:hypothetical protein [Polaromonas sp.]MDO9114527.1 hypothetical protein [Polaromonas sp.]MDP3225034.1 hypothetical protein [Rubrivivax sp.]
MKTPLQLAQWAAYEKITRQREQEANKKTEVRTQKARLLEEAAQWNASQHVRGYVAMVLEQAGQPPSPQIDAWAAWALDIALATDPISARIADLVSHEPFLHSLPVVT